VGQVIDVALYEAVFNCMESLLPEYSAFGAVREPAGSALPGIAPSNAYRCSDGGYALIAGNGDSIFKRLMAVIGRTDLGNDPALADNAGRVARVARSTPPLAPGRRSAAWTRCWPRWTRRRCRPGASTPWPTLRPTRTTRRAACCRQVRMDDGSDLAVPGIVPKLSLTPGVPPAQRAHAGPGHRRRAARGGPDDAQIAALRERGIVAGARA
jgi:formyl-CoA transferase